MSIDARVAEPSLKLCRADLFSALCKALDLVEGQPPGHCLRCCWIGIHVAQELGLENTRLFDLYYTLLLKDLGCSSNAARICQLYLTDDLTFKRDVKVVDTQSVTQALRFVLSHTGLNAGLAERFRTLFKVSTKFSIAREMIEARCTKGADISRSLRFSEEVAKGIQSLDEHWNGRGNPRKLAGHEIPLFSRIALLSQTVDVFQVVGGRDAALAEVRRRSGTWFDPEVVAAFERAARSEAFWETLTSDGLQEAVLALEPAQHIEPLDDAYLDDIAEAFAQVIDAKSPYTSGHSERVTVYTGLVAEELGLSSPHRRWLRRAALLHDIGKLGVSNAILDKPGKLNHDEWAAMQGHATQTRLILEQVPVFRELAEIASAHHERPDGKGYPYGLKGDEIALETRIITVADIFDALTADRPYRRAMQRDAALELMAGMRGTAIDNECFNALSSATSRLAKRRLAA